MNIFHAIVLSIVEGLTEFLPISSTGHLVLASELFKIAQTDFVKTFEIAIQLGAIAAVALLYFKKILESKKLIKNTLAAFIPTAVVGLVFYKIIKTYLLGNIYVTIISLLLGGIFIIFFEKWINKKTLKKNLSDLTLKDSLYIGLAQSVSVIPGVSRAAATIFGSMFLGYDRVAATEFSFILAIPTMAAATGLDLLKSYKTFTGANIEILIIGTVVSFVVALFAVKFLLGYVKKNNFIYFGVYRILVSILFIILTVTILK